VAVQEGQVVLDVGGVGYLVHATTGAVQRAATSKDELTLHTYLNVREDALQLFGFATLHERMLFERLTAVQGVGPKVALAIVSAYEPAQIARAAQHEDVALLQSIPGVGPKMARRLATELKDKLGDFALATTLTAEVVDTFYVARDALVELGIPLAQAEAAVRTTDDDAELDDRVRQALQAVRA
jgi:Holliday junction DNA helicase RuvA